MTHPSIDDPDPKVWVGCVACYNSGRLVGAWFDATTAPQQMAEFNEAIAGQQVRPNHSHARTVEEIHEELWCFDHDGFAGLLTGECSPTEAARLGQLIADLQRDGIPVPAYAAYREDVGAEYATLDGFLDAFCGHYDSPADYAEQLATDLNPSGRAELCNRWPYTCIDWDRAWQELHLDGDNHATDAPGGGFYIFRAS